MPVRFPRRRQPESVEQAHGVQLLRSLGGRVYVSGTRRRRGDYQGTMQSEGIPDVEAFLPPPPAERSDLAALWILLKWEVKAEGGRLRPEQADYRDLCIRARIAHVVGRLDDLIAWLIERDYLKPDQVAHHHLPKEYRP